VKLTLLPACVISKTVVSEIQRPFRSACAAAGCAAIKQSVEIRTGTTGRKWA
jgi:hypothetical protein